MQGSSCPPFLCWPFEYLAHCPGAKQRGVNFGAEPLNGVSSCDWAFVEKGLRHPPCLLVGNNELVFLLLPEAIVSLFHSTCNSPVVQSSLTFVCWHKPLFPCCTDSVLNHVWLRVPLLWRVVTCLISRVRLVVADRTS